MADPILITSGGASFGQIDGLSWSVSGDGFSAMGVSPDAAISHCFGVCVLPFQLINPVPYTILAHNGHVTFDGNTYLLLPEVPDGPPNVPYALGSLLFAPQGALPTVTEPGFYDAPFDVSGKFCFTEDPHIFPPPNCVTIYGTANAHYTVLSISTTEVFQPPPTMEIVTPEPGTSAFIGIPLVLCAGISFLRWRRGISP
jgi:hypothetical protein